MQLGRLIRTPPYSKPTNRRCEFQSIGCKDPVGLFQDPFGRERVVVDPPICFDRVYVSVALCDFFCPLNADLRVHTDITLSMSLSGE